MSVELEDIKKPIEYYRHSGKPGGSNPYVKDHLDVSPITDSDLASLGINERTSKIKERQINYWRPLLSERFPELYDGGREESIRLLETLYYVQFRELEMQRTSGITQRNVSKLKDAALMLYMKEAILSKDAEDKLKISVEDISTHTSYTQEDIVNLVNKTAKMVKGIYLGGDVDYLHYKSPGIDFKKESDGDVIRELIVMSQGVSKQDDDIETSLAILSQNMLDLYWNNLYRLYPDEEYPITNFAHDYLYGASQTIDYKSFENRADWVMDKLDSSWKEFAHELDEQYRQKQEEEKSLQRVVRATYTSQPKIKGEKFLDYLLTPTDNFVSAVSQRVPQDKVIGKYFDRLHGLEAAVKLLKEDDDKLLLLFSGSQLKWMDPEKDLAFLATNQWNTKLGETTNITTLYDLVVAHAQKDHYKKQEQEFRQHRGLKQVLDYVPNRTLDLGDKEFHLRTIRNNSDMSRNSILINSALLNATFIESSPSNTNDMRETLISNEELIRQISDENIWFVAVNGDQFNSDDNSELEDYDISSITFYPERKTKGGHRVVIKSKHKDIEGSNFEINILINRQGKLEFPNTEGLIIPHWLGLGIQNTLLKRINFITLGALSKRDEAGVDIGMGEEKEGKDVVVRRSHYRYLTSTDRKKFTLQSPEAKRHAAYVLKEYGIDIYEENLRRRLVGTLKDNQVITFVKEVKKGYAPPNQLAFDPYFKQN